MADPVRHSDLNTYLKRAEQALAEAKSATLGNVRERCLRAEAAWRAMAERAERSERIKADEFARKRDATLPGGADTIK